MALIEGRIAARMTQRDLAKRLGISEQQVQRWGTQGFIGVGFERLQEIADVLGVEMHGTVAYDVPGCRRGAGRNREPGAGWTWLVRSASLRLRSPTSCR